MATNATTRGVRVSRPRFETTWGGSFILVEPGEFLMGSEDGTPSESPSVTIILQHPFFLGARPVTQATWQGVMGQNPARFQDGWHTGLNPVERVSYIDACDFISRLNETPSSFLGLSGRYRLPTEAEWEFACRAGTRTRWSFGDLDRDLDDHGWHAGNSGASTRLVGTKNANLWGFHDMHGNINEWTDDDWSSDHTAHSRTQEPQVHDGSMRKVVRGGAWYTESDACRSSARRSALIDSRKDGIGLRLVWDPF